MVVNFMFKSGLSKIHAIILIAGLLLAGLYFMPGAEAAGNEAAASSSGSGKHIVKWVDSQGVTHYGDKLPAQEAGRNNSEMSNQGIVVKRNEQTNKKLEQEVQLKLEQQRKDNILLASYTKAEEIDLARDRNLEMDQASLQALNAQKDNVSARIARNQKTALGFETSKKPLPTYLTDELKLGKLESSKLDKQIVGRKQSMEATRKRFADEKNRFLALKQASVPDASAMTPASTVAPQPSSQPLSKPAPATAPTATPTSAKAK